MPPNWGLEGPWESKTVLKSSWFGSLVVLSFGIAFLVVLGSFSVSYTHLTLPTKVEV